MRSSNSSSSSSIGEHPARKWSGEETSRESDLREAPIGPGGGGGGGERVEVVVEAAEAVVEEVKAVAEEEGRSPLASPNE